MAIQNNEIEQPEVKNSNDLPTTKVSDVVFTQEDLKDLTETNYAKLKRSIARHGMELDPKYVDVIRKRYAKFKNNGELPEDWQELTPEIARGKQDG